MARWACFRLLVGVPLVYLGMMLCTMFDVLDAVGVSRTAIVRSCEQLEPLPLLYSCRTEIDIDRGRDGSEIYRVRSLSDRSGERVELDQYQAGRFGGITEFRVARAPTITGWIWLPVWMGTTFTGLALTTWGALGLTGRALKAAGNSGHWSRAWS